MRESGLGIAEGVGRSEEVYGAAMDAVGGITSHEGATPDVGLGQRGEDSTRWEGDAVVGWRPESEDGGVARARREGWMMEEGQGRSGPFQVQQERRDADGH